MPELVIGRLLQTLTAALADGVDELDGRRISVGEFCRRVELVRITYGKINKVLRSRVVFFLTFGLAI